MRTAAGRDPAAGSNNRTKPGGAIKGLFRKAAKAATNSGGEPKRTAKRRRRGDTKGELRKPAHVRASKADRPAARGRYTALWRVDEDERRAGEKAADFAALAELLCKELVSNAIELLGRMFEDLGAAFSGEFDGAPDPCNPFDPAWQQPYTEDHAGFGENVGDAVPPPAGSSPNL